MNGATPVHQAVLWNKVDVLRVMLEKDSSLGYVVSSADKGTPLLNTAAFRGRVDIAQELLRHCPDAPYRDHTGWTCLHLAVHANQAEFVEFILRTPQLRKLINMRYRDGKTALHFAVQNCNPKIVAALLFHKDIDLTMFDSAGLQIVGELSRGNAKSLNWV